MVNPLLECPSGTYGSQCNGTCEDSCKDKMCHSATGMCTLGCIDGKIGDTCRQGLSIFIFALFVEWNKFRWMLYDKNNYKVDFL